MSTTGDTTAGLFDGRYRIIGRLGQGGMARVLLAEDESLHRKVALKLLDDRYADDTQFLERFDREARAAAGLNHPNIVHIYDRGEAQGQRYIAMEYLEGETLKQLIQRDGPLAWRRSIDLMLQILAALRFAHRNGVIHRDVKPQNILILRDGRAKVMDFGIARAGASEMTEAGAIIGTAQYLAPEQARGLQVGPPADLYSCGVVLYEMLTGRVPFDGDSAVAVAMKHIQERAVPVRQLNPSVPPDLAWIVERAMTKDPAARYQTADEMGIDLDRVRKNVPVAQATRETAYIAAADATAATRVTPGYAAGEYAGQTGQGPPLSHRPEERKEGGGPGGWLLAGLIALLIVGLGVAAFALLGDRGGGGGSSSTTASTAASTAPATTAVELVRIPKSIKGIPEADARAQLKELGLDVNPVRRFNGQVPAGFVIDTNPPSGTQVKKGDTVDLLISRGQQLVTIDDVRGKTYEDAKADLEGQGFTVNPPQRVASDTFDAGVVIDQSPPGGEQRAKGTPITLQVSSGPAPVKVPSVVGQDIDSARALIEQQGLRVGSVTQEPSNSRPQGQVISSDPPGGASVKAGSSVDLVVSSGPETASVPDVRTKDVADATAELNDAGFRVRVTYEPTEDPTLDGLVKDQDPPGKTSLPLGETVTLLVYRLTITTTTATTATTGATT